MSSTEALQLAIERHLEEALRPYRAWLDERNVAVRLAVDWSRRGICTFYIVAHDEHGTSATAQHDVVIEAVRYRANSVAALVPGMVWRCLQGIIVPTNDS